jgi:hypothetical protein
MKHGSNTQAYRDELEAYAQKFGIDISQVLERYQPSAVRLTVETPVDTPAPAPPYTVKDAALYMAVDMAAKEGISAVNFVGVDRVQHTESEFTEVADDSEPSPDADPDNLFAELKRKYDSRQDS